MKFLKDNLGCIGMLFFFAMLFLSAFTNNSIYFGIIIIPVMGFALLAAIFNIFSGIIKLTEKKEIKISEKSNSTNNDKLNGHKKSSDFSFKVIKYTFIVLFILTFFTCASRKRVGAICRDGTSSSSYGSGTCSHHNGVSSWKYEYWWE